MKTLFLFFAALVGLSTATEAQLAPPKDGDKLDAVIAVVGKRPIYKSSIDAQTMVFMMRRGQANANPDSLMVLRREILESEINQKLILAKADEDSITVSEQEVDEQIDQQVNGLVTQLGSKAAVEQAMGRTIAEFKGSPENRELAREKVLVGKERYKILPPEQSVSRQ